MATRETIRRIRVQTLAEGGDATRRDLAATAAAAAQLGQATGAASVQIDIAARRQINAGSAFDSARMRVDGVYAATARYEKTLRDLNRGIEAGGRDINEYNQALTLAREKFDAAVASAKRLQDQHRAVSQSARDAAATEESIAGKRRAVEAVSKQVIPARDRQADIESAFADADRRRASMLPRVKAEQELSVALTEAADARKLGIVTETEYSTVVDRANTRFHDQVSEIDKAEKAHKRLANGAGLSAYAYQNLGFQVNDVVTSLASGISPMQTFAQQGGQILQVLQMGEGGVKGALKGIATTSVGFVAGLGAATVTLGGFIAASLLGGVAAYDFSNKTTELNRQLLGIGRSSGATVASINAMAEASASAAGVSEREFRSMAGAFAATGEIGESMYLGLIKSAKDFSRVSGQDLKAVTAELAAAFAAPAAGAEALNKKYNILNFTQLELIRRLDAQGNKLGAQKIFQDAYNAAIDKSGETISGWGRISGQVADYVSDRWTRAGALIDKAVNGGTLEDQLAYAQRGLEQAREARAESYDPLSFLFGGNDTKKYEGQIQKLRDLIKSRDDAIKQGQVNKDSVAAGETLKGLSPAVASIQAIEDKATDLESKMGAITLDKQGEARRAIDYLRMQAKAMREDLEKGGAGLADALKTAQFNNKMVGATGYGLDAATVNKKYDDETADAFRKAGTNVATDEFNSTLQNIDQRRELELDTLKKTVSDTEVKLNGALGRMKQAVRDQVLEAAKQFPNIPPDLIAAIAEKEGRSDPNTGPTEVLNKKTGLPATSAYGMGQITKGTAADAIKMGILPPTFDRMDPSQGALGIAGVLEMKRRLAGNNLDQGVKNYYGSGTSADNAYYSDIQRRRGTGGGATVEAVAGAQDNATKALREQKTELELTSRLYGINTEKLNTQARALSEYQRMVDAGMPPNEKFKQTLIDIAAAAEKASRDVKLVQFERDTGFAREQLGRTDEQQQAYATARSMYGDTNDSRSQKVIDEVTKTQGMLETKNMIRDGAQGFISELRRTGDAAGALANVFGNIADRMISKVLDSLVSSAFSGGGAGGGGFLASLFADGGIMTSSGKMPLHAYSSGGIANSPQLSLFGEGRLPEAYVPLPDGKRIPVAMSQPANSNGGGGSTMVSYAPQYNFPQQIDGLTPQQASAMIDRKQEQFAKNLPTLVQNANRRYG